MYQSCFRLRIFCSLNELIEQYTKEEQETETETENISNLDTSLLQSATEVTQTKENVPLSLIGDISEIIVEDTYPEEASTDAIVDKTDGKDPTEEPMTTIFGSFLC